MGENDEKIDKRKSEALAYIQGIDIDTEFNEDEFERIEKALDELDELDPVNLDFDIDAMYMKFKNELLPIAIAKREELQKIYDEDMEMIRESVARTRRNRTFIALVASCAIITFALNYNAVAEFRWLKPIMEWGSNVLNMISPKEPLNPEIIKETETETLKQYSDLKYVERDQNAKFLKLNYLPEGFMIDHISVLEYPTGEFFRIQSFYAVLATDKTCVYTIEPLNETQPTETSSLKTEELQYNGITFNMYEMENWIRIAWEHGNLLYTLAGNMTKEEAQNMVKSIK